MWVDDRRVVRKERREKRIGGMRDTWRSERYHNRRKYRKKIGGLGEHQNVNDSREKEKNSNFKNVVTIIAWKEIMYQQSSFKLLCAKYEGL